MLAFSGKGEGPLANRGLAGDDSMGGAISLQFDLAEGKTADLEIISAAAIAWVETLRAAAQSVEPGTDVKVELIDVDQGSAIFNVLGRWFDRAADAYDAAPRRQKLIRALAIFTICTGVPTYQAYFGDSFDDEDRERMKRIETTVNASEAVETARRKFYRTVEREPSITAITLKNSPDGPPIVTIANDEFPQASGLFAMESDEVPGRVTQTVLEVVLVKPALVHTPRAWTFKPDGLGEFDAVMRDARVLQAIQDRGFPSQMREGIRMTIRLEAREVMTEGQWKLVRGGRSVLRVISPKID